MRTRPSWSSRSRATIEATAARSTPSGCSRCQRSGVAWQIRAMARVCPRPSRSPMSRPGQSRSGGGAPAHRTRRRSSSPRRGSSPRWAYQPSRRARWRAVGLGRRALGAASARAISRPEAASSAASGGASSPGGWSTSAWVQPVMAPMPAASSLAPSPRTRPGVSTSSASSGGRARARRASASSSGPRKRAQSIVAIASSCSSCQPSSVQCPRPSVPGGPKVGRPGSAHSARRAWALAAAAWRARVDLPVPLAPASSTRAPRSRSARRCAWAWA